MILEMIYNNFEDKKVDEALLKKKFANCDKIIKKRILLPVLKAVFQANMALIQKNVKKVYAKNFLEEKQYKKNWYDDYTRLQGMFISKL